MNHTSTCTGCGAALKWAFTEKGRRMPLDAEPVEPTISGTYVYSDAEHIRLAQPLLDPPGLERWMPHWGTCPMARTFRKENRER